MPVSPLLASVGAYPFTRLDAAKREAAARGIELLDFGTGDPREVTPEFIRAALVESLGERSSYPAAHGLPELRAAVARWCAGRFGVTLDPEREIIPTLGSKEAIFSLPQVVVDRNGEKNRVLVTDPGYPVPERGAVFAGAEPVSLALEERNGFLPDLDAIDDETWARTALFWVNYPNNPTGATAPLGFYERLAELARRHDFVLASDEAYSELWFDERPASALQLEDRRNVLVLNSLSKRSSMTGYRSGFAAGDPELIAALRAYRPNIGTAPQEFVQRAAVAAWGDEEHVERARQTYARKREIFLEVFERKGVRVPASRATMYLWIKAPPGLGADDFSARLLEDGVVVSPGSFFGRAGEGYVRLALVPTLDECRRAATIMEALL